MLEQVPGVVRLMNAISGVDPNDDTTRTVALPYSVEAPKNHLRIALLNNLTVDAQPEVSKCIYSAMDTLSSAGCICEELTLNSLDYALASYYVIAMAEASSNLARYNNIRYGFNLDPEGYEWNSYFAKVRSNFGEEVKRRIIVGTYVLSSGYYGRYYLKAQKVRALLRREFKSLYSKYDVIIAPTMPILPFRIGEKIGDPIKLYYVDIDTVVSNLTGMPAISIPAGFSNGLPIGLQIMSDEFQEQKIFDAAYFSKNGQNSGENSIMMSTYGTKIGLEIHCQLTGLRSKLFCSCHCNYREYSPNENICPTCTGLPGTLPLLNQTAIEIAEMVCMALRCIIPNNILLYRKNYFYSNLPKNFQLTQYNAHGITSIGVDGLLGYGQGETRIRRVQLEEDPGRLSYMNGSSGSLIDYNRAGIPLVEIVTEPDFMTQKM